MGTVHIQHLQVRVQVGLQLIVKLPLLFEPHTLNPTYSLHCSWLNQFDCQDPTRQPEKGTTKEIIGSIEKSRDIWD